jgi:hypothetical protein
MTFGSRRRSPIDRVISSFCRALLAVGVIDSDTLAERLALVDDLEPPLREAVAALLPR